MILGGKLMEKTKMDIDNDRIDNPNYVCMHVWHANNC